MRNSRLTLRAEADAARAWQAFAPVSFLHGCEALCPGPPESDQRRLSATHVARPLVGAGCGASTDAPGVDEPGVKAAAPPAVEPDSEKVAQCTEAFNELTYLKLSRDDDDDEDGVDESFKLMCMMSALAALKTNTTVKSLSCRRGKFDDTGVAAVAAMLLVNKTITDVDLSNNVFGPAGVAALADMLKTNQNKTLTSLTVHENGNVGDAGVAVLAAALKVNRTVTYIGVGACGVGDEGASALAKVIPVNTSLEDINAVANCITDVGATELVEACAAYTRTGKKKLQHLRLNMNNTSGMNDHKLKAMKANHVGIHVHVGGVMDFGMGTDE
jgi:hypothetical protein